MNLINTIKALDTKTLLALYNELTGKNTTKFASRAKGEGQVMGAAKVAGLSVAEDILKKLGASIEAAPAPRNVSADTTAARASEEKAPEQVEAPEPKQTSSRKPRTRKGTNLAPVGGSPVACREGSKQAILLDTLARENGATMAELIAALSGGNKPWTEATVRSGFGWDMKLKGYGVRSFFQEDGTERFYIVLPQDEAGNAYPIPAHRPLKSKKKEA